MSGSRAEYQRTWRAARKLRRGGEPCTWVAPPVELLSGLVEAGWSQRRIARAAGVSHQTVGHALAGGRVFWSTRERLRTLAR